MNKDVLSRYIDHIKNKIERCIQYYQSLEQTVTYLHEYHCMDQVCIRAVWRYLERDNQKFFKEYYKRCELIRQIVKFNELLAQQSDIMHRIRETDLRTTAPVTQSNEPNHHHHQDQLNHHQYQLNNHHHQLNHHQDKRIESSDFVYPTNSISSYIDPFAPTQPNTSISDLPYNFSFGNLSEQFGRDLSHQQEVYPPPHPQEHKQSNVQVQEEPPSSDASTISDFGDGFNYNNAFDSRCNGL